MYLDLSLFSHRKILQMSKGTVSWERLKKLWQKFTELGLKKGRGWFLNFFGLRWFYNAEGLFIAVNASLRWLNNGQLLFFVSPPKYKWSIIKGLVALCQSFLIFIIFNIHSYNTIIHSFILHHFPRPVFLYLHRFSDQQEKPLWGANPRIELEPAMQQADPLPLSLAIP